MLATKPTSTFFGRHHCSRCHGLSSFFLAGHELCPARYAPPHPCPPISFEAYAPSSGHVLLALDYRRLRPSPLPRLRPRPDAASAAPYPSVPVLSHLPDTALAHYSP